VKNTEPNFLSHYENLLKEHKEKFSNIEFDIMYEYKPTNGKLHAHLLLTYETSKRKRKLAQYPFQKKGWSVLLEEVRDLDAWTAYYKKNMENQEQIIKSERLKENPYEYMPPEDVVGVVQELAQEYYKKHPEHYPYLYPRFDIRKLCSM